MDAVVVYSDDFFIMADTFEQCLSALNLTITLLCKLGFQINWNKVIDPCTKITFLGIEIDSEAMCLKLPDEKLVQVCQELDLFLKRKRASRKQLQSLAGKLNVDTINMLKADGHKVRLSEGIRADIAWWHTCMASFNGRSMLLDQQPISSVFIDSCELAGGGVFNGDQFYVNWDIDLATCKAYAHKL